MLSLQYNLASPHKEEAANSFPIQSELACHCFHEKNVAEMTLHDF